MMVLDNGLTIDEFIEQVFNYPRSANFTNTRPMRLPRNLAATSFAKVKHEIPSSLLYLLCALCVFALTFSPVFSSHR